MRSAPLLLAAFALVAGAYGLLLESGAANTGSTSSKTDEKNAAKDIRASTKTFGKEVKSIAGVAVRAVNGIAKAIKTGKRLDDVTGVAGTPGRKANIEQLRAALESALSAVQEYQEGAVSALGDAYSRTSSSSAIASLLSSGSARGVPGTPGPLDGLTTGLERSWAASDAKVVKALRKLQTAMADAGLIFTFQSCVPPKLAPAGSSSPVPSSTFLWTAADSQGGAWGASLEGGMQPGDRAFVALRNGNGDIGARLTSTSSTAPFPHTVLYSRINSSFQGGGTFEPLLETGGGNEIAIFLSDVGNSADVNQGRFVLSRASVSFPGLCLEPSELDLRETFSALPGTVATSTVSVTLPEGNKTFNSNKTLAEKFAEAFIDGVKKQWGKKSDSGSSKLARLGAELFPCGNGPNGFTVCPEIPAPDPGGELIVIGVAYAEDIPLSDPSNRLQYGFVFDQDGNASNNYVPPAQFEGDYFRDSDKWYAAEYAPGSGWVLKVTDARGGSFRPVASAARVIINGNAMTLAVPASEFAVTSPSFRTTSFRHTGDFGQNPPFDWTADYDPEPGTPLQPFSRE